MSELGEQKFNGQPLTIAAIIRANHELDNWHSARKQMTASIEDSETKVIQQKSDAETTMGNLIQFLSSAYEQVNALPEGEEQTFQQAKYTDVLEKAKKFATENDYEGFEEKLAKSITKTK